MNRARERKRTKNAQKLFGSSEAAAAATIKKGLDIENPTKTKYTRIV